jgi:hypothetical protein
VYREREKERKNREIIKFFFEKNELPEKKFKKNKKMTWDQGSRDAVP